MKAHSLQQTSELLLAEIIVKELYETNKRSFFNVCCVKSNEVRFTNSLKNKIREKPLVHSEHY